jgi:uncharacterized protein DUF2793
MPSVKLEIPYLSDASFQKSVLYNTGMNRLDAMVQIGALDYANAPGGSPVDGDTYLVGSSPTGAFTGHAQAVAYYLSGAWLFFPARPGMLAYDATLDGFRYFDGSAWTPGFGATGSTFLDLTDAPADYTGDALKYLRVNAGETGVEFQAFPTLITTLLGLTDTPDSYTSQALKLLRVNAGATAIEFVTAPDVVTLPTTYPYDLAGSYGGVVTAETVLLRYPFPRAASWAEDAPDSQAVCAIPPADATALLLKQNGVEVGQILFAAFATVGTFTLTPGVTFALGDVLTLETPALPYGLGALGWAFALTRSA